MKHLRILSLALFCLSLVSASAAYQYQDTVEIKKGSELSLDGYDIRYAESTSASDPKLEILETGGSTDSIIYQEPVSELYSREGELIEVEDGELAFTLRGFGWDGATTMNLTLDSSRNIFVDSDLSIDIPDRVISARDGDVSVPVDLENSGTRNQSFRLESNSSEGIATMFSYQDFNVTSVQVASGSSKDLTAEVSVTEQASIGDHEVTLKAVGASNSSESFTLEVRGNRKERTMSVDLEERRTSTRAGDILRPELMIRNTGEANLENVEVMIETPDGWDLRIRDSGRWREINDVVRSREREYYRPRVDVPDSAENGDYYVKMKVRAEGVETESKELRVNVASSSGLSGPGLAILGFSILLMVGTYWKLGRR